MEATGTSLKGFITEKHFAEAEVAFPGISGFFAALAQPERPTTFLELVWKFEVANEERVR